MYTVRDVKTKQLQQKKQKKDAAMKHVQRENLMEKKPLQKWCQSEDRKHWNGNPTNVKTEWAFF